MTNVAEKPYPFVAAHTHVAHIKLGFHMIAPIARVASIARNSVQTIQAIIWKQ